MKFKCPVKQEEGACTGAWTLTPRGFEATGGCGEPCGFGMRKDGLDKELVLIEVFQAGIKIALDRWPSGFNDLSLVESFWPEVKQKMRL